MGRGRARGGEEAALEKSKEWGAAAVYCSQPWWHSPGCTGSTAGVHPMHLDAPALPLLFPVPSPRVRLLGVPWAGRSELCWPSLSLLSPTPGTILALPRCWAALRSFAALKGRQGNAEREERGGKGHTGSSQEHGGI